MIPYGRQTVGKEELEALAEVLSSPWMTQGPKITEFETVLATRLHVGHAVALSNGTAALHIACAVLGVQKGDIVWTVPNTFVASANAALYCGASVDFVDIDKDSRNISVDALQKKLQEASTNDTLPKVLVVVHFAGASCDMAAIRELTENYGIFVIEDAAHALGSHYKGTPVGSCRYSDIATFSFHPVKNIATGEGGAIVTNNAQLAEQARRLVSHGVVRDEADLVERDNGRWYYEMQSLGWNYRITDLQCALGIVQLEKLDDFIQRRRDIVTRYQEAFASTELKLPIEPQSGQTAWHIYVVELPTSVNRNAMIDHLNRHNIMSVVHYIPVHYHPYYQQIGFKKGLFPVSEAYYERTLTLPLYPALSVTDQQKVIDYVKEGLQL